MPSRSKRLDQLPPWKEDGVLVLSTHAEDGDPLDAAVLDARPARGAIAKATTKAKRAARSG